MGDLSNHVALVTGGASGIGAVGAGVAAGSVSSALRAFRLNAAKLGKPAAAALWRSSSLPSRTPMTFKPCLANSWRSATQLTFSAPFAGSERSMRSSSSTAASPSKKASSPNSSPAALASGAVCNECSVTLTTGSVVPLNSISWGFLLARAMGRNGSKGGKSS